MMISSKESCGTDIPNTSGTRRGMFSRGYYNPPYQISGQHYMAGIDPTGVHPAEVTEGRKFVELLTNLNLREGPNLGAKKIGIVKDEETYKTLARAFEKTADGNPVKVGDIDRVWYLIGDKDGSESIGWVCAGEALRTGEKNEDVIIAAYLNPSADGQPLSTQKRDEYIAQRKEALKAMDAFKNKANKDGKGSKTDISKEKIGPDNSGLSTTSMVLIGLGAAALVFFLIQKGKK